MKWYHSHFIIFLKNLHLLVAVTKIFTDVMNKQNIPVLGHIDDGRE